MALGAILMRNDYKKVWQKKAREYLAIAFGSRCAICGYDGYLGAFDYHHLGDKDRSEHG